MDIQYFSYLPETYQKAAIDLYFSAFNNKLGPIFRDIDKGKELLLSCIDSRYCIAAIDRNQLVGMLAFSSKKGTFSNASFSNFLQTLGVFKGLYAFLGLLLFFHEVKDNEWYIDGIVVADDYRGQGVGTAMLKLLEEEAAAKGGDTITLDVVDTNPRAQALYKRYGFLEGKREYIWPVKWLFQQSFDSSLLMKKTIIKS
jgi:ribosomal protein S18 acetylase RimI-like enzyme